MKNKWLVTALKRLLLTGISTVAIVVLATQVATAQIVPAQNGGAKVEGDYSGVVKLQFIVAGVYSDTLPMRIITDMPNLGSIDLPLSISQAGDTLNGYGSLDKTLVFSVEQTINDDTVALKISPSINGNFDGINLTLLSERVAATHRGRPIQRQFRLTGAIGRSDGSQLGGQYRETIWGLARQPITVIGVFRLQRPSFDTIAPDSSSKAPNTVADMATTTQEAVNTPGLLTNDSDANGNVLTVTSISKLPFGTATTAAQTMTYTRNVCAVAKALVRYSADVGKDETVTCTSDATPALCQYPWP